MFEIPLDMQIRIMGNGNFFLNKDSIKILIQTFHVSFLGANYKDIICIYLIYY